MPDTMLLHQDPAPGSASLALRGDWITFRLTTSPVRAGGAFLRTTVGRGAVARREIIDQVELGRPKPGCEWHDVPMVEEVPGSFAVTVRVEEVGRFEARAFFLQEGSEVPLWPQVAGNTAVKVEPEFTRAGLGIYAVFPRLFREVPVALKEKAEEIAALEAEGFSVLPPSGTFRDVIPKLGHIVDELGFRILLLLPVFPTPVVYGRMGRFGSPFAARDFFTVDPALAEFDRGATPMEQFGELVDATHARGARIFIDVPINHTGWASRLLELHPEWFVREADGSYASPGAWGVTWEDLVELKYEDRALWREMAEVFLFWCGRGVDGFRCDAGYMIPTPVWQYITARVRDEFPDTIFLLEGLGGPVDKTQELLAAGGLDWAYSELFQNFHRTQVDWYLPQAIAHSAHSGLHVHFAETHDNNRLAAQGAVWARMRTALAALCSPNGAWGVTCGVEWFAAEKIHVHGTSPLNWGAEENQVAEIAALNRLLAGHPAFQQGAVLRVVTAGEGNALALRRDPPHGGEPLLIVANLDSDKAAEARWAAVDFTPVAGRAVLEGDEFVCTLAPGEIFWLPGEPAAVPPASAPEPEPACTLFTWPRDRRRVVPWPDGRALKIEAPVPFRFRLEQGGRILAAGDQTSEPLSPELVKAGDCVLQLTVFEALGTRHATASLFRATAALATEPLPPAGADSCAVLTNGRGAMSQVRAAWGRIETQYDALLAANLHSQHPTDRRIIFTRCRAWVVRRGFSTELSGDWVTQFAFHAPGRAVWDFSLPAGDDVRIALRATLELAAGKNEVRLTFARQDDTGEPVRLIVRPDVEDRDFHDKTHLPSGAMTEWRTRTSAAPGPPTLQLCCGGALTLDLPGAAFTHEPEVTTVGHPFDAGRGLGGHSDLYSPGWFDAGLPPGASVALSALVQRPGDLPVPEDRTVPTAVAGLTPAAAALSALRQFIVTRDDGLTVIAGYPWFLDWGRDTLICLRGIISAGWFVEARGILKTFARFEDRGSLPNMIRGADDSNRSTSDAPLWFFVAVADLLAAEKSDAFLDEAAGGRTIREVLLSIARHYREGTPHGIRMDPDSGLIFSPSHYTWMDTNHPAGTPRQGYPVSLQAKWHCALKLLARMDQPEPWTSLAAQVRESIHSLYTRVAPGFLSDCLHAAPGQPARDAVPDDHLRPNQLFAITLGAVDDPVLARSILAACEELLVPGAIRTLADRPVTVPLAVYRHGQLLNDPHHPFWPHYTGDEDTRRKPAYHNGTAWPWVYPSFAEALLLVYGEEGRQTALSFLGASRVLFEQGAAGHLPEIIDGGAPHTERGCGAQAWSVSELHRVLKITGSV